MPNQTPIDRNWRLFMDRFWMRHVLIVALLLFAVASTLNAQTSTLGKVEFSTSGSPQAQAYFLRGLAALHSFWYEEALEAFRESTRIEPDFMMGYWGEAMTYNHPLWSEQDTPAGKIVVAKIKDTARLTRRERAYLDAVKLLYSAGDKNARDVAYSAAMEKIYRDYPDDLDAAAFYSLSLLGLVQPGDKGFRLQARAGAIALEVYQKNPNHPGAAHYIIHAFDDPEHAILALPAARRYAEIAPEAHHARHMPSHIFLQLGMWPEAAASNESAWESSDAWMKRKNLSPNVRDYHSLNWLLYVYLQQGRYRKAEELLTLMKKTMSESTYDNKLRPGYYENNYANMAAAFVIETERWKLAPTLFPQNIVFPISTSSGTTHGGHGAAATESNSMTVRSSTSSQRLQTLVVGFAIAHGVSFAEGVSVATGVPPNVNTPPPIGELEVKALTLSLRNEHAQAIETIKTAVALEEQMAPPSGPPALIKPTHELFGEILLRGGKPAEALEQFNRALLRQPNRARSLLGAARAAMAKGDPQAARSFYAKLAEQWQQADNDLAELREAQDFLKQAKN